MQKTKAIVLLIAASVLLVAVAGIAISQLVSAQTAGTGNAANQTSQTTTGNGYGYGPQQGTYPNGQQYGYQNGAPNGYRRGMACADAVGKLVPLPLPSFLSLVGFLVKAYSEGVGTYRLK